MLHVNNDVEDIEELINPHDCESDAGESFDSFHDDDMGSDIEEIIGRNSIEIKEINPTTKQTDNEYYVHATKGYQNIKELERIFTPNHQVQRTKTPGTPEKVVVHRRVSSPPISNGIIKTPPNTPPKDNKKPTTPPNVMQVLASDRSNRRRSLSYMIPNTPEQKSRRKRSYSTNMNITTSPNSMNVYNHITPKRIHSPLNKRPITTEVNKRPITNEVKSPTEYKPNDINERQSHLINQPKNNLQILSKSPRSIKQEITKPVQVERENTPSKNENEEEKLPTTIEPQKKWNYKKGDIIGQGANGRVFLSFNLDKGEFFAVKEIAFASVPPEILEKKLFALQREISVMKNLKHENIVQYYGAEKDGTTLNIFLEYVPGGSLASLVRRYGRLSEDVVKQYTKQILLGLNYLHQRKIVHRDIKGANVLVSVSGVLKLADFGASRQIQDLITLTGGFKSLMGTPHWMAPEVIMQTGHGRSADIWSVGCTVLEMYSGKPPFSEFTTAAAVMFHIASTNEPPKFPDFASEGAKDFLSKCFIRDPKLRPTAEELLQHEWLKDVVTPEERRKLEEEKLKTKDIRSTSPETTDEIFDVELIKNKLRDSMVFKESEEKDKNANPEIIDFPLQENPVEFCKPKPGFDNKKSIKKFLKEEFLRQSQNFKGTFGDALLEKLSHDIEQSSEDEVDSSNKMYKENTEEKEKLPELSPRDFVNQRLHTPQPKKTSPIISAKKRIVSARIKRKRRGSKKQNV